MLVVGPCQVFGVRLAHHAAVTHEDGPLDREAALEVSDGVL
jgi:hypothetical protein